MNEKCIRCGQRVGWIGITVNIVLVFMKVLVGLTAGSKACLADALHSSSNIITAFAILISRRLTSKPSDDDHPYGYGKAEFIAAAAVSVLIMILTLVLIVTSIEHILYKAVQPPHITALFVAVVSIASNELLYRYFYCAGTQLRSQTIIANAWANRADCFSSLAVVIGVIGSYFGFHHLDPVAAVVVAIIIIKVSLGCIRDSIAGLMDRSVSEKTLHAVMEASLSISDVKNVGRLRGRLMGDKIWIDLSVSVSSLLTVDECEQIRSQIQSSVFERISGIGKIFVDFEPVEGT